MSEIDPTIARALETDLKSKIRGEVRFGHGDRAMYSTDASNYRQVPIGIVLPKDSEDVVKTHELCRKYGVPIVSRGGGTSLAGQTCNVAVVLDFSKYMNRVLEVDPEKRLARVQPGTILDTLRSATREYGLTLGPDPATHTHCTLGGMIGNNSCGIHAQMSGRMQFCVESMEILTYDGVRMRVGRTSEEEFVAVVREGGRKARIYSQLRVLAERKREEIRRAYPPIPRRVSGFNLEELLPEQGFQLARSLVGTEGTCVTILEATVNLMPLPKNRALIVLGYPDVYQAGDHLPEILPHEPIGLEGMDDYLARYIRKKNLQPERLELLPEGKGWLLVEFGSDERHSAEAKVRRLIESLKRSKNAPKFKIYTEEDQMENIWKIRESGLGATAFVPGEPDTWPGWEDAAVPPERVGNYLREFRDLLDKYGYACSLYGHFGQGCIHVRIDFELTTPEGRKEYREFVDEAADLVVRYGGSLSGEHGDGQARGELLHKMYGESMLEAFREFKSIWDPDWKMNPGKVINARPILSDLRLGEGHNPAPVETHFTYPSDGGDFRHATTRCVGVGKCRRLEGEGTMCPSFMVTREEKHSTRGRARLLFEMLEGAPIKDKWRDESVKEALDLCLACKGCKSDCPVSVDMATYKAEFQAQHYQGRLRPMPAYTMGLIYWWARLASQAPRLVNAVTQAPGLSYLMKLAGGIAQERRLPRFAEQTFKDWFLEHPVKNRGAKKVILWADTFNNNFHPATARAAVRVLEAAGFDVRVPQKSLCCGRPLYDFGFLTQAKRQLNEILDHLGPALEKGVPIVCLEPSCMAVFKDELQSLFPKNERAKRLGEQSYLLTEFLAEYAPDFEVSAFEPGEKTALVHGHCHQKSLLSMKSDLDYLTKLGFKCRTPETGCCGMAGAFGFEKEKYDVSVACAERVLLPEVESTSEDDFIITNGFSCREQISQLAGRRAYHTSEILDLALGIQTKPAESSSATATAAVNSTDPTERSREARAPQDT